MIIALCVQKDTCQSIKAVQLPSKLSQDRNIANSPTKSASNSHTAHSQLVVETAIGLIGGNLSKQIIGVVWHSWISVLLIFFVRSDRAKCAAGKAHQARQWSPTRPIMIESCMHNADASLPRMLGHHCRAFCFVISTEKNHFLKISAMTCHPNYLFW